MLKNAILRWCLLLIVIALSNTAFAASSPPYASIVAFNYNGGKPNINTLPTLDIINMTPWDISIGSAANTQILKGMTKFPLMSFWMQGINTAITSGTAPVNAGFAFHSIQLPLANPNGVWQPLDKQIKPTQNDVRSQYMGDTYKGTVPIVFNTKNFTQSANTVALNFIATSSARFASTGSELDDRPANVLYTYPATTLSFSDGTHNYGWKSNDTNHNSNNATHFLMIQQLQVQGTTNWKPITNNLAGTAAQKGVGGQTPGATVECPELLTISGLAYPGFSSVAGVSALPNLPNQSYDLVVILQSGGYADMQLLFLAVPSSNNALLSGTSG